MLLVDRHILRGTIHLAGRSHHHTLHALVAGSLADVERALDVGINIAVGGNVTVRNGNESGKMQHSVAAAHDGAAEIWVAHIAAHHLKALVMHIVEPAPVVERIIETQSADVVALAEQ